MKITFRNFIAVITASIVLAGCGGSSKPASVLIPKSAGFVLHINAASLSSKLSWEEIKSSDWFKMLQQEDHEDMTPLQKSILDNPENSGVDMKGEFYAFYDIKGKYGYMVFEGKLADPKKFETIINSSKEKVTIKKEGNTSFASKEDVGEGCFTWTNDKFIFISANDAPASRGYKRYYDREQDKKEMPFTMDSLFSYAKEIYGMKQGKSMGGNDHFTSVMKEQGDMHMFINSGAFPQEDLGPMTMLEVNKLTQGNESGFTISFDNGKVNVNSKTWYNKDLTALMEKNKPGKINEEMLRRIPSQNLAAVIAMNYPPQGLKDFLKLLGADGLVNGALSQVNLSIDDFVKANKGDLLLAVTDFSVKEKEVSIPMGDGEPYTYTDTKPDANFLFATSIGDKASFTKLMDVVKDGIGKSEGAVSGLDQVKYSLNGDWFVMGNDQQTVDNFAAGSNASQSALLSQISGHSMGGFIDLQKMLANVSTSEMKEKEVAMLTEAAQTWDNIVFWGGEREGKASVGHIEINMKDKSTNSLKQFFSFLNKMALAEMADTTSLTENPAVLDSATMAPIEEVKIPVKPGR